MKENIPEEDEQQGDKDDENKDNKAGLDVSSDEEGDGDDKEGDGDNKVGDEEDEGMEKVRFLSYTLSEIEIRQKLNTPRRFS